MSIENVAVFLLYHSTLKYMYILTLNIVDNVVHSIKTSLATIRIYVCL